MARRVITEAGCMGHARRKFFEVYEATDSPTAPEALRHIATIYKVEPKHLTPEARVKVRRERAGPLLGVCNGWMEETLPDCHRRSDCNTPSAHRSHTLRTDCR